MTLIPTNYSAWMILTTEDESEVRLPISSFNITYAINSIPSGQVNVPTGRSVFGDQEFSQVHPRDGASFLGTKQLIPVSIYAQDYAATFESSFRVFEGYVVSVGESISEGSSAVVFQVVHWLLDLDATPALTAVSHPRSTVDVTWRSVVGKLEASTQKGPDSLDKAAMFRFIGSDIIDKAGIESDLWVDCLQPWLTAIAEQSVTEEWTPLPCLTQEQTQVEAAAIDALKRFEGDPDLGVEPSRFYKPLSMNELSESKLAAQAIAETVADTMMSSFQGQSLWQKLLQYGADYTFQVIPRVETAMIAPLVPTIRSTYEVKLPAREEFNQSLVASRMRPIKAVVLAIPYSTATGAGAAIGERNALGLSGAGCFAPEDVTAGGKGSILYLSAPKWVQRAPIGANTPDSSFLLGGSTGSPSQSGVETQGDGEGNTVENAGVGMVEDGLFDRYAQYLYTQEVLRGSGVSLSSKFRLDIGPGCVIELEKPAATNTGSTEDSGVFVGTVQRVTLAMDVDSQTASSSYQLTALRTAEQNQSDTYTVASHPIYGGDPFVGAPLVDPVV